MRGELDELDRKILTHLVENGRENTIRLAKLLQVPRSTVALRIKKLEEAGYIKGYTIRVGFEALGKPQTAFLLVQTPHVPNPEASVRRISQLPGVEEVHIITGSWDILVKVRAKSIASLWALQKLILKDATVGRTETIISFQSLESLPKLFDKD